MFGAAQAWGALHYGFDLTALYLRLDPSESPQRTCEACSTLRVEVIAGGGTSRIDFDVASDGALRRGRSGAEELGSAAFARVLEIAIPFEALRAPRGATVALAVHALRGEVEVERLPRAGHVVFAVPDEDFERVHWRV
jgi:hypothetical protein